MTTASVNASSSGKAKAVLTYTVTNTDTQTTLTVNSIAFQYSGSNGSVLSAYRVYYVWGEVAAYAGGTIVTSTPKFTSNNEARVAVNTSANRTWTVNKSLSVNKTHAVQNNYIYVYFAGGYQRDDGEYSDNGNTILYFNVPAKTSYNVTYNANGGSTTPAAQTKWYGENLTLRGSISRANSTVTTYTVTLKGNGISDPAALKAAKTRKYTFAGWNTNSGGTGTNYSASATYSANAAATLYAKWTSSDSTAQVTFPSPTRSGYTFGGWGTTNTATTAAYAGGATLTPTQDVTYHAIWKRTITYNGNVPSGVSVSNVPSPATSVASSNTTIASGAGNTPTRTGYLFKGWATTSSATTAEYQAGDNYAANKPTVTLYAVWQSTVTLGKLTSVRCNSSGTPTDDGDCALLTLPWSVDESVSSATKSVSFSITGDNGSTPSHAGITLSGTSGTISTVVQNLSTEIQYTIAVTVSENVQGGSATARDTLSRAYFTMDVLGDAYYDYTNHTGPRPGHGIAFGMPAKEEGMHVGYPITRDNATLGNWGSSSCFIVQDPENFPPSQGTNDLTSSLYGDLLAMRQGTSSRAHIRAVAQAGNGANQGVQLETARVNPSNANVYHGVQLLIDGAGNRTVVLSDPTAWRNGLGASSGVWPVAQGGTGISNFFTVKIANGSTTSVSSSPSSYPRLASISLEAGTWLIVVGCYSASGTGSRVWAFSNATSMSGVPGRGNTVQVYAATANSLYLPLIWTVSPSATTTYYVYGWQNTGSALNMSAYVIARKMS